MSHIVYRIVKGTEVLFLGAYSTSSPFPKFKQELARLEKVHGPLCLEQIHEFEQNMEAKVTVLRLKRQLGLTGQPRTKTGPYAPRVSPAASFKAVLRSIAERARADGSPTPLFERTTSGHASFTWDWSSDTWTLGISDNQSHRCK